MTAGDLVLGLVRGAHMAAAMSALGIVVFRIAIAGPASSREPAGVTRVFNSHVIRLGYLSFALTVATAGLWLLLQSADFAEEDGVGPTIATVPIVLFQSRFGTVLIIRLGLIAAAMILARRRSTSSGWASAGLAAGGVALEAALGHGASMEGPTGWMLIAVESLHLVAAGTWLGGLIPLLLFLRSSRAPVSQVAVLRFSRLGLVCVVTLALTIVVQSWILIGGLPGFVGTEYGMMALLKLALFLGLLGIGALNRFRYTPALVGETEAATGGRLRRSVALEAVVGLCAILAAGVLLTQPPAIHQQPDWPFPYQFSLVTQSDPELRNETLFGATLAIVAFACLCLAAVWRRGRLIALAAMIGFAWSSWPHLSLLLVPAYPTSFYHSPTGFTAASIARGSELFARHCTSCHGEEGRGNGPLAKNLPIPAADLTASHLFEHSDGEMFWWLSHGIEGPDGRLAMPGFADALDEDARWNLIDYVRAHNAGLAIARGGQPPKPIMAPDIMVTVDGRSVSISAQRGRFLLIPAGRDKAPRPLAEVTIIPLMPDSDDWTAYATVAGVGPAMLDGTEFLVDPDGWLRAVIRPSGTAWPDPDRVAAAIKDAQAHPIASDDSSAMRHHH